jgi:GTP-binding protein HflX
VGYTNAGKTTLFNLLTGGTAETSDALFVTLDPLVRQMELGDRRELLVSDTVGFIDRLPHTLVAAFRATLEQVTEADLILHIIDAASVDRERHVAAVGRVLEEVGASAVPLVDVFNKCDMLSQAASDRIRAANPEALCISALTGDGREALIDAVVGRVALDTQRVQLEFDSESDVDRERIAAVYRQARVLSHVTRDGRVSIEADVPRRALDRVKRSQRPAGDSRTGRAGASNDHG